MNQSDYHFYGYDWDYKLLKRLYRKLKITNWVVDNIPPKEVVDCFFVYLDSPDIARNIYSFIHTNKFINEPVSSNLAKKAYIRLKNISKVKLI